MLILLLTDFSGSKSSYLMCFEAYNRFLSKCLLRNNDFFVALFYKTGGQTIYLGLLNLICGRFE